jgi:hypothetical protein
VTADSDLRATLQDLTADRDGWRWRFEADAEGWWWLTENGHRAQRTRWRPRDEADVFVAATTLFGLNGAGRMPIPDAYLEAVKRAGKTEAQLRRQLAREAYHLELRLRTGRPSMAISGDWRNGWTP